MLAVVRHGDRTPKQKMKMVVTHEKLVIPYIFIMLRLYLYQISFQVSTAI